MLTREDRQALADALLAEFAAKNQDVTLEQIEELLAWVEANPAPDDELEVSFDGTVREVE